MDPMELMEMTLTEDSNHADHEPMVVTLTDGPVSFADKDSWDDLQDQEDEPDDSIVTCSEWTDFSSDGTDHMSGCPECGLAFHGLVSLRRHQLQEHGVISSYTAEELAGPVTPPRTKTPIPKMCYKAPSRAGHVAAQMVGRGTPYELYPFKCPHCISRFRTESYLLRHVSVMHINKAVRHTASVTYLQCQHCPLLYKNESTRERHMKKVHSGADHSIKEEEKEKECPAEVLPVAEHSGKLIPCPLCPMEFLCTGSLKRHVGSRHATDEQISASQSELWLEYIKCQYCHVRYKSEWSLRRHMAQHGDVELEPKPQPKLQPKPQPKCQSPPKTSSKYFFCPHCSVPYTSSAHLQRHVLVMHGGQDSKQAPCPPASDFGFPTMGGYSCKLCPARYKTERQLLWHLNSAHVRDAGHAEKQPLPKIAAVSLRPIVKCQYCDTWCRSQASLRQHEASEHAGDVDESGVYHCEHCPKKLKKRSTMANHMERKHHRDPQLSVHQCTLCPLNYLRGKFLIKHVAEAHGTLPPDGNPAKAKMVPYSQCELCPLRFEDDRRYQLHLKCRHRSNRYQPAPPRRPLLVNRCELCDRSFGSIIRLQRHLKSVHRSEVTVQYIQCESCPLRFNNKYNLQAHVAKKHQSSEARADHQLDGTQSGAEQSLPVPASPQQIDFIQCEHCPMRFTSPRDYSRHINCRHKKLLKETLMVHACKHCGRRFQHLVNLEGHSERCPALLCGVKQSRPISNMAGDADKVEALELVCPLECIVAITESDDPAMGVQLDSLESDGRVQQSEQGSITGKESFDYQNSLDHSSDVMGRDTLTKLHGCSECGLAFYAKAPLRKHRWKEHGIQEAAYKCEQCSRQFEMFRELREHRIEHVVHNKSGRPRRQVGENKGQKENGEVDQSEERNSNSASPEPPQDTNLQGGTTKALVCEHCPRQLSSTGYLRLHMTRHHPEHMESFTIANPIAPRPVGYSCPQCSAIFQNKNKLNGHLKKIHSQYYKDNECRYGCNFCGAKFDRAKTRQAHLLVCRARPKLNRVQGTCLMEETSTLNEDSDSAIKAGGKPRPAGRPPKRGSLKWHMLHVTASESWTDTDDSVRTLDVSVASESSVSGKPISECNTPSQNSVTEIDLADEKNTVGIIVPVSSDDITDQDSLAESKKNWSSSAKLRESTSEMKYKEHVLAVKLEVPVLDVQLQIPISDITKDTKPEISAINMKLEELAAVEDMQLPKFDLQSKEITLNVKLKPKSSEDANFQLPKFDVQLEDHTLDVPSLQSVLDIRSEPNSNKNDDYRLLKLDVQPDEHTLDVPFQESTLEPKSSEDDNPQLPKFYLQSEESKFDIKMQPKSSEADSHQLHERIERITRQEACTGDIANHSEQ